ncbi:MAG: hypothetical protein KDD10_19440, partial [Phaeodactylibacter sp.]|nr:hypothetical protein [Phaeodactylibacter sp.]
LAVPFRPALRHVLALVTLLPDSGHSSIRTKIHRPETTIYLFNRVLDSFAGSGLKSSPATPTGTKVTNEQQRAVNRF